MMIERDFRRLQALILSRIEGDTDPWAREVRALLQGPPDRDLFPPTIGFSAPVAREEFPAHARTADAWPIGEPLDPRTDRF